uniref:ANK_REP_REGION domain-containing protein n=1 Tax=Caenorhabditis tropicalis TaxID=1561998 RepID=A0A1I7SY94_9PELO
MGSNFSNILAETFRIPLASFQEIIAVKTDETIKEIDRMSEAYDTFNKDQEKAEQRNISKLNIQEMETGVNILEFFAGLEEKDFNVDLAADKLLKTARSMENDKIFGYCKGVDESIVHNFYQLFKERPETYVGLVNNGALVLFKDFLQQTSEIINCLEEIRSLKGALDNLTILEEDRKYEPARKAMRLARELSALSTVEEQMSSTIEKICQGLENSRLVWNVPSVTPGQPEVYVEKSLDMLSHLSNATTALSSNGNPIDLIYTAGFKEPKDWLKVLDDLKSPWFQKHISQGASVQNLSNTLEPYSNLSKLIVEMDSMWKSLVETVDDDVIRGAQQLKDIREFALESGSFEDFLNNSKQNFKKCMQNKTIELDKNLFFLFESEKQPVENLVKIVKDAMRLVTELSSKLSKKSNFDNTEIDYLTYFVSVLHFVEMELNDTTTNNTYASAVHTMDQIQTRMKWFIPGNESDFFEVLNLIADVKKRMNDVKITVKKVITPASEPGIKTILTNMKISELVTCLRSLAENFGKSLHVIEALDEVRASRKQLLSLKSFTLNTQQVLLENGLVDWLLHEKRMNSLLKEVDLLEKVAEGLRNKSLMDMATVFEEASKIEGLAGNPSQLRAVHKTLSENGNNKTEIDYFDFVKNHDLDFAKHSARLSNARITTNYLNSYFDDVFGRNPVKNVKTVEKVVEKERLIEKNSSWVTIIISITVPILLLVIIGAVIYGFTAKGREHYITLLIYYFGKPKHFEKRWRYSLFMDRTDEKNALLDAVRETNQVNLKKVLKDRPYISAYNTFGNTALHLSVKLGLPEIAKELIKNGADQTLKNSKNLLPNQMIPVDYKTKFPERAEKYEEVQKILKKYENKRYRIKVPRKFPVSSFHIYGDEGISDEVADKFLEKFRSIWIFQGTIIMKEQWMIDCLSNPKLIERDVDYLIEKVNYKGKVFDTVLQWSEYMAKGKMPYL